jgi:2-polyprenyl-6-methoxyphenol hydroxylase-like FAD-dependent oxidoreductase
MGDIVVLGAGPVGLVTAMLLAKDGHEVTVLEKDAAATPSTGQDAWVAWDRKGVGQFRSAHYVHAKLWQLLDAELPEVRDELLAAGGRRHSLLGGIGNTVVDRSSRPGDERFETVTARRPVLEDVFARVAENSPGVNVVRGVAAVGPIAGVVRDDVPHVDGVKLRDGNDIRADFVIDAMGRRSKIGDWIADVGGRAPYEESLDAGFSYYSRHYRSPDGALPEVAGPYITFLSTLTLLTLPTDGDTWVVFFACSSRDQLLKAARDNTTWERIVRAVPHAAHWLDAEPIQDVSVMAGVLDRYRRFVIDGQPVVTGLIAVGDAWACTNPQAGRGITTGVRHAVALRDALREHDGNPLTAALAFDDVTERTCTPWYRTQVENDRDRFAAIDAAIDGREPPTPATEPARRRAAFATAAAHDSDVARAFLEVLACQALPQEIFARPGFAEQVEALAAEHDAPVALGPNRAQLAELIS